MFDAVNIVRLGSENEWVCKAYRAGERRKEHTKDWRGRPCQLHRPFEVKIRAVRQIV
jgi:hypothetical protein